MQVVIGVRALIESVCRRGGLVPNGGLGSDSSTGMNLHRLFYKKANAIFPAYRGLTEYALSRTFNLTDVDITVQGRADLVLWPNTMPLVSAQATTTSLPSDVAVIEVKSYAGLKTQLNPEGYPLNWDQALLYTCLLHNVTSNGHRTFTYHLAYISLEDDDPLILTKTVDESDAFAWLINVLQEYGSLARNEYLYRLTRDASIKALHFPYPQIRQGQRELMSSVLAAIASKVPLLAQAPTGTGKTVSTLYPSIKAIGNNLADKIFYLTAKTTTRQVASETVNKLYQAGLMLRTIILSPKEQLCLSPEIFCDLRMCPYAIEYYDRLPEALIELKLSPLVTAEEITSVAKKFNLCPFELALDFARCCDLIIGDYNHFFDPRIRLIRFFSDDSRHHIILCDEAHNLAERTRDMYSAELSFLKVHAAKEKIKSLSPQLVTKLDILTKYFAAFAQAMKSEKSGFEQVEKSLAEKPVFQAENFRAVAAPLPGLRRFLFSLIEPLHDLLDNITDFDLRRPIMDFYFELLFFLRIHDEYFDESYVTCVKRDHRDIILTLRCQDTSSKLVATYKDQHIPIFFSATMAPLKYYKNIFCGQDETIYPDILNLASPFPAENLLLLTYTGLKTTYEYRNYTLLEAAKLIWQACSIKPGNYLVFFPSYRYLNSVASILSSQVGKNWHLLQQKPNMSPDEREAYLSNFADSAKEFSTIGLAVLGGSFSEGIDLSGDRLNGVIIIGVGLPQLSPERELLKQYFDFKLRQGFNFAYLFPGFSKVMQAAGRLIRSEYDRGFIILADERYAKPEYVNLFPEYWHPAEISTIREVETEINNFYKYFES